MMPELLTGEEGIEPPSGVLETLILPMNYSPRVICYIYSICYICGVINTALIL